MKISSILADAEMRAEILDRVARGAVSKKFPSVSSDVLANEIADIAENPDLAPSAATEAIILATGRPALFVQNGTYQVPASDVWNARLEAARVNVERAISAVGRVEVKNHGSMQWIGTGWFVAADVVVTNRHVASEFAARSGGGFQFLTNAEGRQIRPRIDLREEYLQPNELEFDVARVLHIEDDFGPDMAILQVNVTQGDAPQPINLADGVTSDTDVAVIGYPAWDGRRNDPIVMKSVFGDDYNVKRLQPGRIMSATDALVWHDCSTLGGNSGSPVIQLSTGEAVGLHFAGIYGKGNQAVPTALIRERLNALGI